jgi:hypothetical protein
LIKIVSAKSSGHNGRQGFFDNPVALGHLTGKYRLTGGKVCPLRISMFLFIFTEAYQRDSAIFTKYPFAFHPNKIARA